MKISLWRRHALTVADGAFSHKIDYVTILNPERHPNHNNGLKVMEILLNGWIFPIGGASSITSLTNLRLSIAVFINEFGLYNHIYAAAKQNTIKWLIFTTLMLSFVP